MPATASWYSSLPGVAYDVWCIGIAYRCQRSIGMPSISSVTAAGIGVAMSSTRSQRPRSATSATNPRQISSMRQRRVSVAAGLNTCASSLRCFVCSGGSISTGTDRTIGAGIVTPWYPFPVASTSW